MARLRSDVILYEYALVVLDKIVFVKRFTYNANHYYTEFINSRWMPGGGLCVLDLKTGNVREVAGALNDIYHQDTKDTKGTGERPKQGRSWCSWCVGGERRSLAQPRRPWYKFTGIR